MSVARDLWRDRRRDCRRSRRCAGGIALFEIVLVIIMISVLFLVAMQRLLPLRGQAEAAMVVSSIGAMQASLGSEVAARVLREGADALPDLAASNPVDLLLKPPGGYQGARASVDPTALAPGEWAFDTGRGVLIYRVRYAQYFEGGLMDPPRGEWQIELHYAGDSNAPGDIRGVLLSPLAGTRWRYDPE